MGYRVLTAQQYYKTRRKAFAKWQEVEWHGRTHTMTAAAAAAGGLWMDRMGVFRQLEPFFRQHAGRGVTSDRLVYLVGIRIGMSDDFVPYVGYTIVGQNW